MKTIEPRRAWLGIALRPQLWRHCHALETDEIVSLYSAGQGRISELLRVNISIAAKAAVLLREVDFDREERLLKELDISFVSRAEPAYPDPLRDIYDPPAGLFYRGDLVSGGPVAAIIGSRRCTAYGQRIAKEMARALAEAGVTVVSGMARGIDTAAHEGACESGRTMAVLGSGLDIIYPPENRALAEKIAAAGALLTEYPPGRPPLALNFPARNRIISALSSVVVIVEASRKSGALITADFALEQGKDVLVVPGSIHSPVSSGCHELLKHGAGVAETALDVLSALGFQSPQTRIAPVETLTESERELLALIDYEKTHMDAIVANANHQAEKTLGDLSMLEARGFVGRRAGGWFYRLK